MPLLNYTTKVDVQKTVTEIQKRLVSSGAKNVAIDYAAGVPTGVTFLIETQVGLREYSLPCDVEAIWQTLVRQRDKQQIAPRFVTKEQAARVGWRIVKDWLEAQLALIESQLASLDQVMLPYMLGPNGATVYQLFRESKLALPAASVGRS